MSIGTIVSSVEEALAAVIEIRTSSQEEIGWLVPHSLLALSLDYGILKLAKEFTQQGGVIRGITTITRANLDTVRTELDFGEDVRHSDSLSEVFMYVGDRQHSISAINIGVNDYTRGTPIACFRSDDLTYAEYLLASFESAWSEAVPAEERIKDLLEQG
ncbi:MAG: hypothetical protein ACXV5H_07920 [Halobacteriota archaeon]